jgi:hypothetical protein
MLQTNTPLDREGCLCLADALGDTPYTVISSHLLRRELCDAYLLGDFGGRWGALVRDRNTLGEPAAYGNSPELILELLQSLTGWFCVDASRELALALGMLIEQHMGRKVRYYDDIYYTLTAPVNRFENESVRRLNLADLSLLETASKEVQGALGFGGAQLLLTDGFLAAAIVDNQVVAIADTYGRTERYADVGVFTLPEYRGRGYSTAAASIVARCVQVAGQTPVWSTGVRHPRIGF